MIKIIKKYSYYIIKLGLICLLVISFLLGFKTNPPSKERKEQIFLYECIKHKSLHNCKSDYAQLQEEFSKKENK